MKIFHGNIALLNPLCFPNLSARGEFIYQVMDAWAEHDNQAAEEIIKKLEKEERNAAGVSDSLLKCEIRALIAVFKANISNKCSDWSEAGQAFYLLSKKLALNCKCMPSAMSSELARKSASKFGYFSTSF